MCIHKIGLYINSLLKREENKNERKGIKLKILINYNNKILKLLGAYIIKQTGWQKYSEARDIVYSHFEKQINSIIYKILENNTLPEKTSRLLIKLYKEIETSKNYLYWRNQNGKSLTDEVTRIERNHNSTARELSKIHGIILFLHYHTI